MSAEAPSARALTITSYARYCRAARPRAHGRQGIVFSASLLGGVGLAHGTLRFKFH